MSLNNNPSDWVYGTSDPSDFTADAVVTFVEALAEDSLLSERSEELERIMDIESEGSKRSSVLEAISLALAEEEADSEEEEEEEESTSEEPSEPEDSFPTEQEEANKEDQNPVEESYSPYSDPVVGSTTLAAIIEVELKSGSSPTLEVCRQAAQEAASR